jgi:hypothetical protein
MMKPMKISQIMAISRMIMCLYVLLYSPTAPAQAAIKDSSAREISGLQLMDKKQSYGVLDVVLWDARISPADRTIPSNLPQNIKHLLIEISKLPELKQKKSVSVRLLFVEKGYIEHPTKKYKMIGVFLGIEMGFEEGAPQRHMFKFDRDEVQFVREVLTSSTHNRIQEKQSVNGTRPSIDSE